MNIRFLFLTLISVACPLLGVSPSENTDYTVWLIDVAGSDYATVLHSTPVFVHAKGEQESVGANRKQM